MRKILSFIAVLALTMPMLTNCSSDDTAEEPKNNEEQIEKKTVNNAVYVYSEDKMVFIALRSDCSVEYCLDKYVMGYGKYEIANNKLTITNEYSGYTDELEITDSEDGSIRLKGHIKKFGSTDFVYIDTRLDKSAETLETSIVGEQWKDSGSLHGETITTFFTFNTSHRGSSHSYGAIYGDRGSSEFSYIARTLIDTDANGKQRIRKIAYYHYDANKTAKIYTRNEDNSTDILYWRSTD